MRRRSKTINFSREVENASRYAEEKEEASCPDLSKDPKIFKGTKSKVLKAFKKENLSDGNEAPLQKHALKCTRGLEKELYGGKEDVDSCQFPECFVDRLPGDVAGERTLPLNSKENVPRSKPVSLGNQCYLTPTRDKAEDKPDCGISEKQQKTPIDFATVTVADFGITQESFTRGSTGKSPTPLKYRRRSTIGVRGSPENNTLIRFLAQQRSTKKKETFTEISPFKHEHVWSLKSKIDAFQASFKSVQEAEGETGHPGQAVQVDDTSQEADSSQNKAPFTKERTLDQGSEKFMPGNRGAALEENLRGNLTDSSKSDTKICTILSSCQDVSVAEPAAAVPEEWVKEQHNPVESSETVLMRDILETDHATCSVDFSSDHIPKDVRSDVVSDLSRKKVSLVEELSPEIFDESKAPVTPVRTGNTPLHERAQSGSRLRSVLKKTPAKPLLENSKEYLSDVVDRGGGESLAVSSRTEISEALQTEKTESQSSEKTKKKKVTFGQVLSPEIFDETLPANTPLRKGATPVRHPGVQGRSPFEGAQLSQEPLAQPNFDSDEECAEPLQELMEGTVAPEALLPVEYVEATTDKPDTITTRSSTKRKRGTILDGTDCSTSRVTNTTHAEDAENPQKKKIQRQKNITTSAAKKTQKRKHASYGKRRKKKVKKSLYGEREMASKKPLLSPIPEIPEVFSFVSSPDSPKANALWSEDVFLENTKSGNSDKDVQQKPAMERLRERDIPAVHSYRSSKDQDIAETSSSHPTVLPASHSDVESASGVDHKFSSIVPDGKCGSDPSDCFQQGEEAAGVKEAEESDSLVENKKLQGSLLNEAEQLTRIEFLEEENSDAHEGAQRTWCPQEDSVRGSAPRRRGRRSSTIYFPPVEKLEVIGNSLPVSSFNIEEVFSVPQLKKDSLEPFRRKSENSGEKRVRRSMRFHKDAEMEGLAWVQVPDEVEGPPLPASGRKTRRTVSMATLTETIHPREQNPIQFPAPGKENKGSVHPADGPCRRWRRKSLCVSTPQETSTWSQTRKRSVTHSVCGKDRSNQKHCKDVETPLENNS